MGRHFRTKTPGSFSVAVPYCRPERTPSTTIWVGGRNGCGLFITLCPYCPDYSGRVRSVTAALRAGLLLTRHPLQVAVREPSVPIW